MTTTVKITPQNASAFIKSNEPALLGTLVDLKSEAQINNYGTHGEVAFYATGMDKNGNKYNVMWHTLDGWNGQDEGDACDWDNPSKIDLA